MRAKDREAFARVPRAVGCALLLLANAGTVLAHPGGHAEGSGAGLRGVVGQRSELTIDAGKVAVTYVAEVPQTRLYQEAWADTKAGGNDQTYLERRLAELPGGLTLAFDGEPLAWSAVAVTDPARVGEPGFVELHVVRTARLPRSTGKLTFRTLNWPDEDGWFATSVQVDGSLVVTSSTLARVDADGELADDRHGAWVKDSALRSVEVAIRPAGILERAEGLHPMTERMEGSNAMRPPLWALVLGGLGLVPIALAGRALGLRAARRRHAEALAAAEGETENDVTDEAEHDAEAAPDAGGEVRGDALDDANDPAGRTADAHDAVGAGEETRPDGARAPDADDDRSA